jgi:predicted XRE-type DNA-binding protein
MTARWTRVKVTVDERQKKRFEAAGWKVADTAQFLRLSDEEAALIELKLGLANAVKDQRKRRKMRPEQLGRMLGSSQSRVAKMEAADSSVSIGLMVRALFRMGASRKKVASSIASPTPRVVARQLLSAAWTRM